MSEWRNLACDGHERVVVAAQHAGAGLGFAVNDLYAWTEAKGRSLLLRASRKLAVQFRTSIGVSPDGRWLGFPAVTNDCRALGHSRNSIGILPDTEIITTCTRLVVVELESGRIEYRTPAALDGLKIELTSGGIFVSGEAWGKTEEVIQPGLGAEPHPEPIWYRVALDKHELSRILGPEELSPDGHFRVLHLSDTELAISGTDGSSYRVRHPAFATTAFRGQHALVVGEFELELEARETRRFLPEGVSLNELSRDGTTAITVAGDKFYWAAARATQP
jgi:hypothetical protein